MFNEVIINILKNRVKLIFCVVLLSAFLSLCSIGLFCIKFEFYKFIIILSINVCVLTILMMIIFHTSTYFKKASLFFSSLLLLSINYEVYFKEEWKIITLSSLTLVLLFLFIEFLLYSFCEEKDLLKSKSIKKYSCVKKYHKEICYVVFCFCLYFLWSCIIPYNQVPDEFARYLIPKYIFNFGHIPTGIEEEVRISNWGFSYALTPILSYQISALFMKIMSIFTISERYLLLAARFTSVLSSTIAVVFYFLIAQKLFKKYFRWVFVIFISILPQMVFISSYVNNDALAILSSAVIFYAWILCLETNWNLKSSILLSVGLGICALSYMNAYGFILCSVLLYIMDFFTNRKNVQSKNMIKAGIIIFFICFIIAGWWFIRMGILYNFDFFGLKTKNLLGETYAIDNLKPSNLLTPTKINMNVIDMLFNGFETLPTSWILITYYSFIGCFGYMSIYLKPLTYFIYTFVFTFCGIMVMLNSKNIFRYSNTLEKRKRNWKIMVMLSIIIPIVLSIWYSYNVDYQPQGRYILPLIVPLMYVLAKGLESGARLFKKEYIKKYNTIIPFVFVFIFLFLVIMIMTNVLMPNYI